jgi:uncharacterized protein
MTLAGAFPAPQGRVTDAAAIIDAGAKTELESLIRATEEKTTAEIAVVTVSSLDGMTVEEYGNRLFNEWGIGKKRTDNGVLVLVAPTERNIRIEVGYGLEPILPDGLAGEIIRTDALPAFRNGHYAVGILASVRRIAAIVEARHIVTAEERRQLAIDAEERPPSLLTTPFFGMFVGIGALAIGLGVRARAFFPILFGTLFGGLPLLMSLLPFFNASLWILGPLAIGMFVFGYRKGATESWREMARGQGRRSYSQSGSSSGWVMGNSGSSSSSSGSSSSSSSFGGGSSGGGGASGSW